MISVEDSNYTYEYKSYYKILPSINNWNRDHKRIKSGKKLKMVSHIHPQIMINGLILMKLKNG